MSSDNSTTIPDNRYVDSVNLVSSTTVASTAYGIMVTLYFICCYFLKMQMAHQKEKRRPLFFICYISAMFAFGTIYIVTTTQATTVSYVYHADFPGGPSYYNNLVLFSAPVGIVNTISYVFANWMADALLVRHKFCHEPSIKLTSILCKFSYGACWYFTGAGHRCTGIWWWRFQL